MVCTPRKKLNAVFVAVVAMLFTATMAAQIPQWQQEFQTRSTNMLAEINRPHVMQDREFDTEAERIFTWMDQFFLGFRYNEILPSALNCSHFLEQSVEELNSTLVQWKFDKDVHSGYNTTASDYVFNITSWLSYSVAPGIRYCFNIGLEAYTYYLIKDEQFGPFIDWFPAFLQNILGSVVTF